MMWCSVLFGRGGEVWPPDRQRQVERGAVLHAAHSEITNVDNSCSQEPELSTSSLCSGTRGTEGFSDLSCPAMVDLLGLVCSLVTDYG